MNSEMQVLRWGIPGWITILTYLVLVLSINRFDVLKYASDNSLENGYLAGLAAMLLAIGIPLGYIVYQIYFFAKWKWPKRNFDKIFSGIDIYEKIRKKNVNITWTLIERTADAYITKFAQSENYQDVMRRYSSFKSRTDRVHGLGASIWGIILSWLLFVLLHFFIYKINIFSEIGFIAATVILGLLLYILIDNYKHSNKNSYEQLSSIVKDIQRYLRRNIKTNN